MKNCSWVFLIFLTLPLLASCQKKHHGYIIYCGGHRGNKPLHEIENNHLSFLRSVKETEEEARHSLVYSYKHVVDGFAAELTPNEASKLSEMEGVVSVVKTNPYKYKLHTTRSWGFVGLGELLGAQSWSPFNIADRFLKKANYGKDIIVGLIDSGIWPESRSFDDHGMGPVPKEWKGICQSGERFNSSHCNRKLIGARYFLKAYERAFGPMNGTEYVSPRDADGHGSHTASTVAGRRVTGAAALGGIAGGTASGGAPLARLAMYKVCWAANPDNKLINICAEEDMLAAIDQAVGDGVHVLSMSIGSRDRTSYADDMIAIGAMHAVKKNVVVVCSAGNDGPVPATVVNTAPWILTVGASSLDRAFIRSVVLGNGMEIRGQTTTPYNLTGVHPLVYAADVTVPGVPKNESDQCLPGSLSPKLVKGKIVLCRRGEGMKIVKGMEVQRAGGAGFILGNNELQGKFLEVDTHVLPATAVTYDDARKIFNYISSTKNPTASIQPVRTVFHQPAPIMATFTSVGPNRIDENILKPDITAPGVDILAAWSESDSPTKISVDHRSVQYNLYSGTSMSCPHVAAAAVLLKAIHPDWSSAAIRSAIMTTAMIGDDEHMPIMDAFGRVATPFQMGSGHFQPIKAADPGLVYDASYQDYLLYLCNTNLKNFDRDFKCPENPPSSVNLNYPSIAIPNLNGTVTVNRIVTNVGPSRSTYFFVAKPPFGIHIEASPSILVFDHVGQKKSFTITVKAESYLVSTEYGFGWYIWTNGFHHVRSPIAVSLP